MNLKSFPSRSSDASSTRAHPHSMGQHQLNRSILASVLSLAAVATVGQAERAGAVDLNFATIDTTRNTAVTTNPAGFANNGPGVTASVIYYTNVAAGMDARITATTFNGTGTYAFDKHIFNYSALSPATQPTGDNALRYYNTGALGTGGLTYKIDLFQTDGTIHNYSTAYVAPDLRFSVYDVDGEPSPSTQTEAVRVFKGTDTSGFVGYQVGTTAAALTPADQGDSYLFSGKNVNQLEDDPSSAALLYFQNTSSVTFQFEANTTAGSGNNPVFSAIDGDVSLIGNNSTNFDSNGRATPAAGFGSYVVATKIPEPFTVIGSLIGGGVALRMRKKLKATSKA
jgi:hypothetical protein